MTPADLAALHARCFAVPRPWSAAEMAEILASPGAFLILRPDGFLIGRVIADEAELMTLAVAPEARRRGTGRQLVAAFAETARSRGAARAFLEVAADNQPAQALYRAAGWAPAGKRRGYYGQNLDAMIFSLTI